MPLNDGAFAGVLNGIFAEMWRNPDAHDHAWYARELAKAINDEIRNGDVQPGIPLQAGGFPGQTTSIGKIQ